MKPRAHFEEIKVNFLFYYYHGENGIVGGSSEHLHVRPIEWHLIF